MKTGPTDPLDLLTSNSFSQPSDSGGSEMNLLQIPDNFSMSSGDQADIIRLIRNVLNENSPNQDQAMMDADDDEPEIDLEDQRSKTEKLKTVMLPLAQLWWSGYGGMGQVAESLADKSRDRK